MNNDNELDRMLDTALVDYVAEPRPGLERRVLARTRADGRSPTARGLRWNLVVGAAACLLIAALVFVGSEGKPKTVHTVTVAQNAPAVQAKAEQTQVRANVNAKPVRRRNVERDRKVVEPRLPKLAQFPSPAPLTQDERALLEFARDATPEALRVFTQGRISEPLKINRIEIKEIQIQPLQSGSE